MDGAGSGLEADSVAGFGASDLGTVGRSTQAANCLDDQSANQVCASVDLTMPRAGRVLVIGDGFAVASGLDDGAGPGSGSDSTTSVQGTCSLHVDNASLTRSSSQKMFTAERHRRPLDHNGHGIPRGRNPHVRAALPRGGR